MFSKSYKINNSFNKFSFAIEETDFKSTILRRGLLGVSIYIPTVLSFISFLKSSDSRPLVKEYSISYLSNSVLKVSTCNRHPSFFTFEASKSIPKIGGAVSKALGSKIAPQVVGAGLGAGAGEAIDPFKKTKDKDVVKAAALGGAAPVVGKVVGDAVGKVKNAVKKEDTEYNYVNSYLDKIKKTSTQFEHHQKDADGNTVPHEEEAAGTPSSIEERTVLEQLSEDGREIDAFEAVISYLLDEGFAEYWEEAEKIMTTLKPELVEEVYQSQLKKLEEGAGEALGASIGGPVGAGLVGAATGKGRRVKKAAGAAGGAVLGKIVGKGVAAAIPVPLPGKMAIGGKLGQAAGAYVGAKVGS